MTDHRIGDWFTGKISQQKQSSLRFYGRHNRFDAQALTTQEIVDFDFRAESSGFVDLKMLEIESSTVADKISILIGELDAEAGEETLVQQAIEELQSIATPGDSITFDSVFINRDGMDANLQRWASLAKYGGRVAFELENLPDTLEPGHSTTSTSDKPSISIQAVWRYKWGKPQARATPRQALLTTTNIRSDPRPMTWDLRVQHAIVDGERAAITLEDDISRRAPVMKAIAKYALYEPLTRQGNFGTSRIHDWGLDEPNNEAPYVGARHIGGAMPIELPPPYSE